MNARGSIVRKLSYASRNTKKKITSRLQRKKRRLQLASAVYSSSYTHLVNKYSNRTRLQRIQANCNLQHLEFLPSVTHRWAQTQVHLESIGCICSPSRVLMRIEAKRMAQHLQMQIINSQRQSPKHLHFQLHCMQKFETVQLDSSVILQMSLVQNAKLC